MIDPFSYFAGDALRKVLDDYQLDTVLDIGCGNHAIHSMAFHNAGKTVHAVDLRPPTNVPFSVYTGDYSEVLFSKEQFDCIWASHVLEHQLDVQSFLKKIFYELKPAAVLQ